MPLVDTPIDAVIGWWHDFYETHSPLGPTETPVTEKIVSPGREQCAEFDLLDPGHGYFSVKVGRCFRHSGWQAFRLRIAKAISTVYGYGQSLSRFCSCGEGSFVLRSTKDSTEFKVVPELCRSRWCKQCYGARTTRLRARMAECLDDKPVRFITLTLRHERKSLKHCLDRLYASFRKLRQKSIWKNRVVGGVAFLEVKRGSKSKLWHPHLHVLVQGRYLPKSELSQTWLSITGDSHNVDIKLVRDRREVLCYVTKYTSKSNGMDPNSSDEDLCEIIATLRGRRTVIPFGTWRSFKLLRQEPTDEWELVGHMNEVLYRASCGDEFCLKIRDALAASSDSPSETFRVFEDQPP